MTPQDKRLDAAPILETVPLLLYRLTLLKYGSLSGTGAALAPGRWNAFKEEAIYTSLSQSTTLLERLVHTPKEKIPAGLAMMTIQVSGHWVRTGNVLTDRHTLGKLYAMNSLGDQETSQIYKTENFFALAVPSVIVPVWNVVLYPERPGFWEHVTLQSVEPFLFDPRLFPDDAVVER